MNCPNCKETKLVMTDRNGIEIDYCPDCRGVWLDRGELDKIIERTTPYQDITRIQDKFKQKDYPGKEHDYRYKKKKSFLDDIFDF